MTIAQRLRTVQQRIEQAAANCQRPPQDITLLAVSKKKSIVLVQQAIACGQRYFGESYLQEAQEKIAQSREQKDLQWHFIGRIQSRKCSAIAKYFHWVHSIDEFATAARLSKYRPGALPPLNVLLQINPDREMSKAGIAPDYTLAHNLAEQIDSLPGLRLRGLMAIPKIATSTERTLAGFNEVKQLFDTLKNAGFALDTLSMGMSCDLEQAIASGSTMLRIGTAIFGER